MSQRMPPRLQIAGEASTAADSVLLLLHKSSPWERARFRATVVIRSENPEDPFAAEKSNGTDRHRTRRSVKQKILLCYGASHASFLGLLASEHHSLVRCKPWSPTIVCTSMDSACRVLLSIGQSEKNVAI